MKYSGNTVVCAAVSTLENAIKNGDNVSSAMTVLLEDYKRILIENEWLKQEVKQARAELFKANETILLFEEPIDFSRFYDQERMF